MQTKGCYLKKITLLFSTIDGLLNQKENFHLIISIYHFSVLFLVSSFSSNFEDHNLENWQNFYFKVLAYDPAILEFKNILTC